MASHNLDEVRIQIPSDPYYLRMVRTMAATMAGRLGFDIQETRNIQVVLSELLSNIILHTYKGRADQVIMIRMVEEENKSLRIRIRDFGPRADLQTFQARPLEDYHEKGLGLFLIRELTNSLYYDRSVEVGTVADITFVH